MLSLNNIEVIYNDVILVLKGMSLEVPEGKIVGLLGSNGAGKSTTLKAISGLLKAEDGEVTDETKYREMAKLYAKQFIKEKTESNILGDIKLRWMNHDEPNPDDTVQPP